MSIDFTRPWDAQWKTRDGRVVRVGDMDRQHRANTMAMLMRNAKRHHFAAMIRQPWPDGDASDGVFSVLSREFYRVADQDPHEWMREQPIYRALAAVTPDGPGRSPRRWQNRLAAARIASQAAFVEWLEEVA